MRNLLNFAVGILSYPKSFCSVRSPDALKLVHSDFSEGCPRRRTVMRQSKWIGALEWLAFGAIALFIFGIVTTSVDSAGPGDVQTLQSVEE